MKGEVPLTRLCGRGALSITLKNGVRDFQLQWDSNNRQMIGQRSEKVMDSRKGMFMISKAKSLVTLTMITLAVVAITPTKGE